MILIPKGFRLAVLAGLCLVAGMATAAPARQAAFKTPDAAVDALIAANRAVVDNQYPRAVTADGNRQAQALLDKVFEPCDAIWRGLGRIPGSGLKLRAAFAAFDAEQISPAPSTPAPETRRGCRCGEVLRGVITPPQCPLFRNACTPWSPQGACMVSGEGTCAAYFRFS